ncbi:LCP family protein [Dactylosporangium sp. CA-233914]|uniref:LCP family protein n=1 Tax=Dactylosporangium sp. CA-233914 TaxID=3239934 RepID=UPI003D94E299
MMDDLIRDAFARHEELVPVAPPELGESIVADARRLRALRRRAVGSLTIGLTGLLVALMLIGVPLAARRAPATSEVAAPGHPLNLLIIGTDRAAGELARVSANAVVLVHVNPGARTAYEVSIPRDLMLDLPGLGRGRADGAYLLGGYRLAADAVADLTGVPLDGGAVVDIAGLESITRAAGGVNLCVEQPVSSHHLNRDGQTEFSGSYGREALRYEPGCRHFEPREAVDYLRQAVGSGDDKVLHQYLVALARAAVDRARLPAMLAAAGDALELHLEAGSLGGLATRLQGIDPAAVTAVRLPIGADRQPLPGGDGLYQAMRDGRVGAWLSTHPQYGR